MLQIVCILLGNRGRSLLWVSDHEGRLNYVGDQWYHLTGQKLGEALGMGWIDALHPDDRDLIVNSFGEACAQQVAFVVRFRLLRPDGTHIWVLGGSSPSFVPLTQDFIGFLGVLSEYEDDVEGLTATAELGSFEPGRPKGPFAPISKFDMAADYLIAARTVTIEYGSELAEAIDQALQALGHALRREQLKKRSPSDRH